MFEEIAITLGATIMFTAAFFISMIALAKAIKLFKKEK